MTSFFDQVYRYLKNEQHELRVTRQAKAKLIFEFARTKNNVRTGDGKNGVYNI